MHHVIHGQIYSSDFSSLEQLTRDFCSCKRTAYSRYHKNKETKYNDLRRELKAKYKGILNSCQVVDAIMLGKAIQKRFGDKSVVFGSRKLMKGLQAGSVTKEQWRKARDKEFYARGNAKEDGNMVTRIVGDKLRVTIGHKKFVYYDLFIAKKFRKKLQALLASGQSYNVRLMRQDANHWKVNIEYETDDPKRTVFFDNGAIAVDTNVDRLAVTEVSSDGNLVNSYSIIKPELKDGSYHKRDYEIGCAVKQIVAEAKEKNKGIVFEDLDFKDKNKKKRPSKTKEKVDNIQRHKKKPAEAQNKGKTLNKIFSNFPWRKTCEMLEWECRTGSILQKDPSCIHKFYR
jgi:transposase